MKRLPNGNLIFIQRVPDDATDESLAEYLSWMLPGITAEQVDVRFDANGRQRGAMISVSNDALAPLLTWALSETEPMPGMRGPLVFSPVGRRT